jgi:hypothetical protein
MCGLFSGGPDSLSIGVAQPQEARLTPLAAYAGADRRAIRGTLFEQETD